jgi:hypothetical protein
MTCGHFDLMGICLSCVVTVVSLLMSQNSEFKFEGSINLLVIRLNMENIVICGAVLSESQGFCGLWTSRA